jgi:hypothetical protein
MKKHFFLLLSFILTTSHACHQNVFNPLRRKSVGDISSEQYKMIVRKHAALRALKYAYLESRQKEKITRIATSFAIDLPEYSDGIIDQIYLIEMFFERNCKGGITFYSDAAVDFEMCLLFTANRLLEAQKYEDARCCLRSLIESNNELTYSCAYDLYEQINLILGGDGGR